MIRVYLTMAVACAFDGLLSKGLAGETIDFVRDIQPLLRQHCVECHGTVETNGSLSFENKASLFRDADSGNPAIVAGEPAKSQLVKRIRSTDDDNRMPPEGPRLAEETVELLTRWIAQGAAWPEPDDTLDTAPGTAKAMTNSHWSFQPLSQPELPPVADKHWSRNAIDRFVQAGREAAGLQVASDADAAVLIRRASYGLAGLPPTSDEVRDFVVLAQSPRGLDGAWADLVDRLLNRSSYGERWGRHWMDWVRYADTAGDNSDYPIPQAYLYRNYIIDAFNGDLPYDRFLTEQLAGDLLPAATQEQRNRQHIATGYLAMARRFGSLVERYPWHLTIEDTIDNLGRTMLGMTIACARCHDHKFDPISTRDYYGLYGFFASTRYPFPGLELFQTQNHFVSLIPDAMAAEITEPYRTTTDRLTSELERLLALCEQQSLENAAVANKSSLDEQRARRADLDAMLLKARKAGEKLAEHLKTIPSFATAYAVQDGEAKNARLQIKGEPDRLGAEVPRKFPDLLGGHRLTGDVAESSSGRLQLADWIASPDNPLTARVIVNRVWQKHFGVGLVPSASDFGLRGEPPTHPELLDWLAADFIRSGWSLKHLHRLIMNSRTYRLSSRDVEANIKLDPGNRWYWKYNRQRLDAESIRDTLLVVAGWLDHSMPTEPHPFPPRQNWKFTQHHPFKEDYSSNQRSVYLMTKRLTGQPYFQIFDGPDPNVCTSDRDQSVTALQALYFVNDEFLHEQASRFAERMIRDFPIEEHRLSHAFHALVGRFPTTDESALMQKHVDSAREATRRHLATDDSEVKSEVEVQIWSSLARSLMRLNEFLYVD